MLKVLKSMLGFPIRGVSAAGITEERKRAALRRLIGSCPLCHGELVGHRTWAIAMVLIQTPESATSQELQRLMANRRWSEASHYREWKADGDMREFRALHCTSGGVALLTIVYKYEMWSDDFVEKVESLESQSAADLNRFIGDRWEPL